MAGVQERCLVSLGTHRNGESQASMPPACRKVLQDRGGITALKQTALSLVLILLLISHCVLRLLNVPKSWFSFLSN